MKVGGWIFESGKGTSGVVGNVRLFARFWERRGERHGRKGGMGNDNRTQFDKNPRTRSTIHLHVAAHLVKL